MLQSGRKEPLFDIYIYTARPSKPQQLDVLNYSMVSSTNYTNTMAPISVLRLLRVFFFAVMTLNIHVTLAMPVRRDCENHHSQVTVRGEFC